MRTLESRRAAAALLLVLFLAPLARAQQRPDQDTVELRGDLVEVRAVVTDKKGRLRDDLSKSDFEITENGSPRDIAFFSVARVADPKATVHEPVAAGAAPAASTGSSAPAGRTVVLFADTVNMGASSINRTRKALHAFVDTRLTENDVAAVVASGASLGIDSQFTRDRTVLGRAIDKLSPRPRSVAGGAFTPYLAAAIVNGANPEAIAAGAYLVRAEDGIPPPMDPDQPAGAANSSRLEQLARQRAFQVLSEAAEDRRLTLLALQSAIDALAKTQGQRLLALVSDGFSLYDRGGEKESAEIDAIIARAVRSGVVIYSITASGLESGIFSATDDPYYAVPLPAFPGYQSASARDLEDGVTALAKDTGGEVFRNTNDFVGSLGKMLDENRIYYSLAYYPDGPDTPGKTRKIDVRLRNHPELTVRAHHGYTAASMRANPVVDALTAPPRASEIQVTVEADIQSRDPAGTVVEIGMHVDGNKLTYREDGDARVFELEIATAFFDGRGIATETKVEKLDGRLKTGAYKSALANGFRVKRQSVLAPGRYQARASVRDVVSGRVAVGTAWVDVPNLGDGKLAMGGVRISLEKGTLVYGVSAFNPGSGDPLLRLSIVQGERLLYRSAWEPSTTRIVGRPQGSVRLAGQLQLGQLPPGTYTLKVEVQETARKQTAAATVEFVQSH